MIPGSCAASSASPTCFAIGSASSIGIAPFSTRWESSSPSCDEFHHQCGEVWGLLEAVDRSDVGMVEGREDFGFALERRLAIRVARSDAGSTLIATWRFRFVSVAR